MPKVKLTVTRSSCRCGCMREGQEFLVEDLCPPVCMELWNIAYPYAFALLNGAELDKGSERSRCFSVKCPDEARVTLYGELIEE